MAAYSPTNLLVVNPDGVVAAVALFCAAVQCCVGLGATLGRPDTNLSRSILALPGGVSPRNERQKK